MVAGVKVFSANFELNPEKLFPFPLDNFQLQAINALNDGKSVVVCAPTGSGKTLVGEYAIYRALARGKRVFYTTPLKALSNQKFRDFQADPKIGNNVGLVTGDVLINSNAAVLVMTTEIFRNMLYDTPIGEIGTSLENVEAVVLDECHYLSDRGRGTVWEESIIYCPTSIQLVGLSATIGNPEELTYWIENIRTAASVAPHQAKAVNCELVVTDHRPVPLCFHFVDKQRISPLLNSKQTGINPNLKPQGKSKGRRRWKRSQCPTPTEVVQRLSAKDMLPAIYIIFSRKGCEQAVAELDGVNLLNPEETQQMVNLLLHFFLDDNLPLQEALLQFLADNYPDLHPLLLDFLANNEGAEVTLYENLQARPTAYLKLLEFLAETTQIGKLQQLEALIRGIASHHAGLLPVWKELVEKLFELGLVKVVFATATLAAGINMPARTTVISALSKRTDDGHSMLSPSEFLQMAGRAGRRGKDQVGHVVTLQSPFEGAIEATYLATAKAEPLKSWFTPSYGMVLNLLQKHSIKETKELLERSFAEYLAQKKLAPHQEAIANLTTQLAKLDVELAGISPQELNKYQKLKERLKEENRLLGILTKQAEVARKKVIAPLIPDIPQGQIIGLKGKNVKTASPLTAVVFEKIKGSGTNQDLICLAADNRWYKVKNSDIVDINPGFLPESLLENLNSPPIDSFKLGYGRKGDATTALLVKKMLDNFIPLPTAPEILQQQERLEQVHSLLAKHSLAQAKNPNHLLKRHRYRQELQENLHKSRQKFQRSKNNQSYYWDDFLNLIKVLQEFAALDEYSPTALGQAAATIRGDNELWLALAFTSGELDNLAPWELAAAVCALITETPRPDSWCEYAPPVNALEALGIKKRASQAGEKTSVLRELRPLLFQTQHRYGVTLPIWREYELIGLVEQWALGVEWQELCENTNLDDGDLVRMIRRTIDMLWQIPQIPGIAPNLASNAQQAVKSMKRFPM
ncbi:MAG: DEAD/DEAH box helicase [Cyanobacteria bacterium J083]|nr:MAG: DEAD/DEAH box helicase [Cyanobacteria bacterium J083]